jgi:uncharacterized membrane protein YphA (DoxX/SURF4 family)
MLSLFPQLLFLSFFAPTLIRIAVGVSLMYLAWYRIADSSLMHRALALLEIVLAAALLIGLWTQVAALIATLLLLVLLSRSQRLPHSTLILLAIMAVTLVVTGPGAFAFDLPL